MGFRMLIEVGLPDFELHYMEKTDNRKATESEKRERERERPRDIFTVRKDFESILNMLVLSQNS